MKRSGIACRAGAVALAALLLSGTSALAEGQWMHHQLKHSQTGKLIDMSFQMHPGRKLTVSVICDAEDRLQFVVTPKPAREEKSVAYRIDGGAWVETEWQADEKRLILDGDAARSLIGRFMMGHSLDLRLGGAEPVDFLAWGLAETLAKHAGRCIK